jgi:hypothetical protein
VTEQTTAWRSTHDLGLAAWFGGSLMGAVGLNKAAEAEARGRTSVERVASRGWARWTPVNAAAIAAHLAGGAALLMENAPRVGTQKGVAASTLAKAALTGAALAVTGWTRVLGKKVELAVSDDPQDVEAADHHPTDLESARRQLTVAQWAVPALTGALVILNALHGEQQRPTAQTSGVMGRVTQLARHAR